MSDTKLGLKEAIESLRSELGEAIEAGEAQQLQFEVGEVELELLVEVEYGGDAGVKFWVATIGGSASRATSHRIRMPLTPKRNGLSGPVLTGSGENIPPTPHPPDSRER